MIDPDQYSDADILESIEAAALYACTLLADHNNPLTVSQPAATRDAYELVADIGAGLALLRQRRSEPTHVALELARQLPGGEIDWDQVNDAYARRTLALQGIDHPTAAQIGERVADLQMAGAWIGAVRGH